VARIVLVDRLDTLVRDARELDGGALANELVSILHSGPRRGVFSAVTVDPVSLVGTGIDLGGPRLVLPVTNQALSAAAGLPRRLATTPGRANAWPDDDDVQVGLPEAVAAGPHPPGYVAAMPSIVPVRSLTPVRGERAVIGVGGAGRLEQFAVDLQAKGPLIVIIGRSRSGRTTALETFAATYAGERPLVRLGAVDSLTWDPDAPPSVVLVDDAAAAGRAHPWLERGDLGDDLQRNGHTLIAAFDQADLHSVGFGHWLMRRPHPGLLLALDSTPDRIVAGERVGFHPPAELRAGPAGRGWWCSNGRGIPVHVAAANITT
jgi:hypothetical protein